MCRFRSRTPWPPPFSSMNSIREGSVGRRHDRFSRKYHGIYAKQPASTGVASYEANLWRQFI
jgi:hypothetical protein